MSLGRRIFYNAAAQTLGKIIALAIGLATISLLTDYLSERGFGQYSTVLAFLGIAGVAADLGLYMFVTREINGTALPHDKVISNALGLRLVAGGVVLTAGAAVSLLLPYDPVVKSAMFVGVLAFLLVSLNQILIGIFQKHLAQHLTTLSEIAGRLVNLMLVYLFVTQALSLSYFILAHVFGNLAIFLFNLYFARKFERFSVSFDFTFWKKILRISWPLGFSVIFNLIYFKADTVILSLYRPQEAVGVYSLPYRILEVLLAFPGMFAGLVMPMLATQAFQNWGKFKHILQKSFDAIVLAVIPMIISTLYFARPIINLVKGGGEFADSPLLLQILIFATGIIFLGTLFGYSVVAVKKEKPMVWGYLLAAIFSLGLYFYLIPKYGYFGAAAGTIITELFVALFAYILVRNSLGSGVSLKIMIQSLPAALALALFYHYVSFPWILEMAAGFALYGLLLLAVNAVPREFVKEVLFLKK